MKRTPEKGVQGEVLPPEANDFDVPPVQPGPPQISAEANEDAEDNDEPQQEPTVEVQISETPEQRRLMREKRVAKAEEEQLRRLTRQFPVIARLVLENEALKQQLQKRK